MMSSPFRKAPLEATTVKGWAVGQKTKGVLSKAWAMLPGNPELCIAIGQADSSALIERALAFHLMAREVPERWIALPTGIDLQVHLRHPGQRHKETLEGGLEAALYGGFDTVITMPNTDPFLDNPEALRVAMASAKDALARYPVRVGFTASATRGMLGQEPTDIEALAKAGAVAITDDGWGVKSAEAQAGVFAACASAGLLFQQHAEMPGHKGVAAKSAFQKGHDLPEYPRSAESEMIRRDIALLRKIKGARYHVLHISTHESLEEVRKAKSEGLAVTAEVTPHHLFFSSDEIPEGNPLSSYFKMNPPLFGPEDKAALREALRDGTIDCVSTDHAPHEQELKAKGWLLGPFGTRGLETALPALLSLVQHGELSLSRLIEVFSSVPRAVLGRSEFMNPTGMLFVDPVDYTVGPDDLPGVSVNSCFLGARLHGIIELRCEPQCVYARVH